jgi:hypothetical protein
VVHRQQRVDLAYGGGVELREHIRDLRKRVDSVGFTGSNDSVERCEVMTCILVSDAQHDRDAPHFDAGSISSQLLSTGAVNLGLENELLTEPSQKAQHFDRIRKRERLGGTLNFYFREAA